jgi:protease PrsW
VGAISIGLLLYGLKRAQRSDLAPTGYGQNVSK